MKQLMSKAIEILNILQDLELLAENVPGIRVSVLTQDDYSRVNIKYNNNEVVIFDLRSAVGEGMKELYDIKNTFNSPYVIVITNLNNDDFKHRCFSLGADKFFDKKHQIIELSTAINELLYNINKYELNHVSFL